MEMLPLEHTDCDLCSVEMMFIQPELETTCISHDHDNLEVNCEVHFRAVGLEKKHHSQWLEFHAYRGECYRRQTPLKQGGLMHTYEFCVTQHV